MTSPSLWQTLGAVGALMVLYVTFEFIYAAGFGEGKRTERSAATEEIRQLKRTHVEDKREEWADGYWTARMEDNRREQIQNAPRELRPVVHPLGAEDHPMSAPIVASCQVDALTLLLSSARRAEQGRQP